MYIYTLSNLLEVRCEWLWRSAGEFWVQVLICLLSASRFSSSLFPQFLSWRSWSCVLWLLHPCTSLRTQEGSFPLWRCVNTDAGTLCAVLSPLWRCVGTDAWTVGAVLPYALPSLPRGVTGCLIGLIPCSCFYSLPWIMASGPLYRPSFVFWDLNKYLSWTCDWIRGFPWHI